MTKTLINELQKGRETCLEAYVSRSELRITQGGVRNLFLTLSDCSGGIEAIFWRVEQSFQKTFKGRFVSVNGTIGEYEGKVQLTLSHLPKTLPEPETHSMKDFFQSSKIPLEQLLQRLYDHIASVGDRPLKALLESIFTNDRDFIKSFSNYPAAHVYHHAFRHGLLQHTLEVVDIACGIVNSIQILGAVSIEKDLVIAGALLHDIGKCAESQVEDHHYITSDEGHLLGHIQCGINLIIAKMNLLSSSGVKFNEKTLTTLQHILLSHHGKSEWGSVVAPAFAEAEIIHQSDLLSAKLFSFEEARSLASKGASSHLQWKLESANGSRGRNVYLGDLGMERFEAIPTGISRPEEDSSGADEDDGFQYSPILREMSLPVYKIKKYLSPDERSAVSDGGFLRLTIYGQVAAGAGILDSDCIEDDALIEVETETESEGGLSVRGSYFLLRVQGDSMTGDGIKDEDLIVVRSQSDAAHGDLVAATLEDHGSLVKRFMKTGEQVFLHSSNPQYPPIPVPNLNALRVDGRVVGIAKGDTSYA